jgi:acyl carrier protein
MEMNDSAVNEETVQKIREIVVKHLELAPDELSDTGLFIEDYAAESLGVIDILAAVETEFGIDIEQSEFERIVSVESIYAVVTEAARR